MTWFKVDDGFWRHRKVRLLGDEKAAAVGVWMLAGSHAADELSDGFVPFDVLRQWDPDGKLTARLIEAELWVEATVRGEDGIQFWDWLDYNPSREKVLADRAREAAKKAKARAALAEKRLRNSRSARPGGTPSGTRRGTPSGSPALPDPGSLPSSGTPAADAGGGAPAAVPAEHVPSSTAETRARAREIAGLRPPPRRRGRHASAQDRPLMASVRDARSEQDRLAELDAVQAVDPPPGGLPPPGAGDEPAVYQEKRASG